MNLKEKPYIRLMRLHQPIGIWLLLWPCLWSLSLAAHGNPPLGMVILFALGATAMRSAGCIVNDLADRTYDAQVERTRARPLASGELTPGNAVVLLGALLLIALLIVLQMPWIVVGLAACSLILVASYPFMKRITWWPQAFLGLTFNFGALMGWAAITETLPLSAWLLYIGGFFWTLGYDTIYAHQDKEDDMRIGVKSTALWLGTRTKPAIACFYTLAVLSWLAAGWFADARIGYFFGCVLVSLHCAWQVTTLDIKDPANCLRLFRSNAWLGALMFAGILL